MGTNGSNGNARGRLWAITCYFNPAGYRRRLENYRVFRRHLATPLVTVELSHGTGFDLAPGDADVLIQLTSPHVLWQKERLLNVALKHLPAECDQVAWLDCDVVFASDEWIAQASRALETHALIEPFKQVYELEPDADVATAAEGAAYLRGYSLAHVLAEGQAPADLMRGGMRLKHACNCGTAWAARREALERCGFYDACIIGSGNRAMACAALGRTRDAVQGLRMNAAQERHYLDWAAAGAPSLGQDIGYIDQTVYHLWHGDLADRGYTRRHEEFEQFAFDPYRDVALDDNACWRWNSDKPRMHAYVRDYFHARREDG